MGTCNVSPSHGSSPIPWLVSLQKSVWIRSYNIYRKENALHSIISPQSSYENGNRRLLKSERDQKHVSSNALLSQGFKYSSTENLLFSLARCLLSFIERRTLFSILTRKSKENQVYIYVDSQILLLKNLN